jgi:signal transduction histidine kinase
LPEGDLNEIWPSAIHPDDVERVLAAPASLIHGSGRHLLSLVEEVLDISRVETGGLSLSLEPVDLGHLVDDAVQVLRPEGAQHEVNLLIEGAGRPCTCGPTGNGCCRCW